MKKCSQCNRPMKKATVRGREMWVCVMCKNVEELKDDEQ